MAEHITVAEAQDWLETTKMQLSSLNLTKEAQISAQVIGRLASTFPTTYTTWTNSTTTPVIVRSIIAMMYAGWEYDTQYSENPEQNSYADRLRQWAMDLLEGIIAGDVEVVEEGPAATDSGPVFFPTDASTAATPTEENPSDGPPAFHFGQIF